MLEGNFIIKTTPPRPPAGFSSPQAPSGCIGGRCTRTVNSQKLSSQCHLKNNLNLFPTALTIKLDQVAVDRLSCGDGKATMCRRQAEIFAFGCGRGQTNVSSAPPSCHVRVTTLGLKSLSLDIILCRDDGWTMSRSPITINQLFTTIMQQNIGLRVPRFEHCRSSR